MKLRQKLIYLLALLCCLPILMGANESGTNLLSNTDFVLDANGYPSNWEQTGSGEFIYRDDEEKGRVVQIVQDENGTSSLVQEMPVTGATAYCVRFDARVLGFAGYDGAYVQVPGLEHTISQKVLSSEWQTVEIYGYVSENQQSVRLAFTFGTLDHGDRGTAEFANIEVFIPENVPTDESEGQYVHFYDYQSEESSATEDGEEQAPNKGATPAAVIALAFVILILVLNSYGAFQPRVFVEEKTFNKLLLVLMIAGAAFRLIFAYTVFGHETDVNDFGIWADHISNVGLSNFYNGDIWCDYPPGYMYVLYAIGNIAKAIGIPVYDSTGFVSQQMIFLIKIPAIICDMISAYVIYRIARPNIGKKISTLLAALIIFNPMVIYDSSFWGQIDSVFTLCLILCCWFYFKNKKEFSALFFIIGVLIKPQMLIAGPVIFFVFIKDIVQGDTKHELLVLLRSIIVMAVAAVAIVLPFSANQSNPLWLIELVTDTTTQYKYATINAYNLYALIGANWQPYLENGIFGINFFWIGNAAIMIIVLVAGIYIFRHKERKAVFSGMLFMFWGIFCFAHSMHERYLYPVIALSALCYALYRDKRFIFLLMTSTFVLLTNSVVSLNNVHMMGFNPIIIFISTVNLIGFVMCTYICFTTKTREPLYAIEGPSEEDADTKPGAPKAIHTGIPRFIKITNRRGEKMMPLDYMNMAIILVAYSLVAMVNLGSTQVPESYWRSQQAGEGVTVTFAQQSEVEKVYYYPGIGKSDVTFDLSSSDENAVDSSYTIEIAANKMYKWQTETIPGKANSITITAASAGVFINEMAFYDKYGNILEIQSIDPIVDSGLPSGNVEALFDEAELIDESPDYMTEMYFDEIYHARTAFEHLNGLAPYENSHPPLGKVFIMLGIWLFGMNPFGWRIIGTLFGIFMLPIMYVFAKRIFKDTRYATLSMLLFALDGMHFVQTRIATIDVYGVFFIMAMCYYMFRYWQMNFFIDDMRKTFVPLGLSGIMFGFGIASKWIGFYAGGGLAVVLVVSFVTRYIEYRKAKQALEAGTESNIALLNKIVKTYWIKVLQTCLFCVVFFIAIPAAIYLASYLPYFLCAEKPYDLAGVWGVQEFMFSYHSKLTATHPFQSPWWQWPIIGRPIYYFSGDNVPEGMVSSIAAFGNPAVWWSGLVCSIACIIMMIVRDRKLDRGNTGILLVYLGAALLPWVFITRATFIYHYFASVPFIILLTVMFIKRFERKNGKMRWPAYALIIVSFALFILFYPVWSGWVINRDFALTYIRWFDSWWFF